MPPVSSLFTQKNILLALSNLLFSSIKGRESRASVVCTLESQSHSWEMYAMPRQIDQDKVDQAVLALLALGRHESDRTWKMFDWNAMNRLHQQGYITDPVGKAKSVLLLRQVCGNLNAFSASSSAGSGKTDSGRKSIDYLTSSAASGGRFAS